jgi:hypothetical protein
VRFVAAKFKFSSQASPKTGMTWYYHFKLYSMTSIWPCWDNKVPPMRHPAGGLSIGGSWSPFKGVAWHAKKGFNFKKGPSIQPSELMKMVWWLAQVDAPWLNCRDVQEIGCTSSGTSKT